MSHPATMKAAREQFDQALVKNLAFYRANYRTGKEWWTARREVAKLVLPIDSTDKVVDRQGTVSEILPDLDAVAKSSYVGKKSVWRARRDAHLEKHTSLVEKAIQNRQGKDLTQDSASPASARTAILSASWRRRPTDPRNASFRTLASR